MLYAIVVDDIALVRRALARQIDESSAPVTVSAEAESGEEALAWLEQHYADVCVTDIRMSQMDGLGLIERINQAYPWMTSIIVSGYDDFVYARAGIRLEVAEYILKPVDPVHLEAALAKTAEKTERRRREQANSLLLTHAGSLRPLLASWSECIRLRRDDGTLADDTLEALTAFAGKDFYLLPPLALAFLQSAAHEAGLSGTGEETDEAQTPPCADRILPLIQAQAHFTKGCRQLLTAGMTVLTAQTASNERTPQSILADKLKAYVLGNCMRSSFTLEELANHAGVSKNHIANVFKQERGVTLWSYVVKLRMQRAKELLAQTDEKNYAVAAGVGYKDSIHFLRLFKETYGMTPQEYRKAIKRSEGRHEQNT